MNLGLPKAPFYKRSVKEKKNIMHMKRRLHNDYITVTLMKRRLHNDYVTTSKMSKLWNILKGPSLYITTSKYPSSELNSWSLKRYHPVFLYQEPSASILLNDVNISKKINFSCKQQGTLLFFFKQVLISQWWFKKSKYKINSHKKGNNF